MTICQQHIKIKICLILRYLKRQMDAKQKAKEKLLQLQASLKNQIYRIIKKLILSQNFFKTTFIQRYICPQNCTYKDVRIQEAVLFTKLAKKIINLTIKVLYIFNGNWLQSNTLIKQLKILCLQSLRFIQFITMNILSIEKMREQVDYFFYQLCKEYCASLFGFALRKTLEKTLKFYTTNKLSRY